MDLGLTTSVRREPTGNGAMTPTTMVATPVLEKKEKEGSLGKALGKEVQQQQQSQQAAGTTTAAPRGQLHVKVISARSLNLPTPSFPSPSSTAAPSTTTPATKGDTKVTHRPFAVLQFEQSEFVSREPIASESEKEVKGKAGPLSRTSSSFNLSGTLTPGGSNFLTPGATTTQGGLSKAFEKAARERAALQLGNLSLSGAGTESKKSSSGFTLGGGGGGGEKKSSGNNSSSDESEDVAPLPTPRPTFSSKNSSGWGQVGSGWGKGGEGSGGFGSGMTPYDPVWKHEVNL